MASNFFPLKTIFERALRAGGIALVVFICGLAAAARGGDLKCDICGQVIKSKYTIMTDYATDGKVNVCKECTDLDEHCFACGLPVKSGYRTLPDGRLLCARDAKEAVDSDDETKRICESVRDDLNRMLSRFITIPETNVMISVVDRFTLVNLFRSPGYEKSCVTIFGATQTHPMPGGAFIHSISLLSNLKPSRLMAVCAHEYTHTWIGQNVKAARKASLDGDTIEAFCELVAYKYMESRGETVEMKIIKTSSYTKGQIAVMLEADRRFGFNEVAEWMKAGEDSRLDAARLDRIRVTQASPASPAATACADIFNVLVIAPTPVPDELELKGISGAGARRFALINNATLQPMERSLVRVGKTNVSVRCLEIRNESVLIQVNGSNEKKELFLRQDQ